MLGLNTPRNAPRRCNLSIISIEKSYNSAELSDSHGLRSSNDVLRCSSDRSSICSKLGSKFNSRKTIWKWPWTIAVCSWTCRFQVSRHNYRRQTILGDIPANNLVHEICSVCNRTQLYLRIEVYPSSFYRSYSSYIHYIFTCHSLVLVPRLVSSFIAPEQTFSTKGVINVMTELIASFSTFLLMILWRNNWNTVIKQHGCKLNDGS